MDPNTAYALVLDTLHRASNQNIEVLKPAVSDLEKFEKEPGFYSILLAIITNHSNDQNVRCLAVMRFKTGVDRYWSRSARNFLITDDEKLRLKEGLLSSAILNEPINSVLQQLAVLISKIARWDYPNDWPKLTPTLLNIMKSSVSTEQHHSMLIFYRVTKVLSQKRLLSDKRAFQKLTVTVYPYILTLWDEYTQNFLRLIQQGDETDTITQNLEKALYCLKILHKLTIFGVKTVHENQDAMNFLNIIFDRAKTTLECRKMLKGRGIYLLELCEKFIILLTKVMYGTLESHSSSCNSDFIRLIVEFSTFYGFSDQGSNLSFERFTIQCLNMLKAVLLCNEYKELSKPGVKIKDGVVVMKWTLNNIFNEPMIRHMCRHLVTHFFLLTNDDLALWDVDPESFAADDSRETWKCSLRPCVETLFVTLFHEFSPILVSELVSLLDIVRQQPLHPDDFQIILSKDAVYNAVGLSAFQLYDEVDFDKWFMSSLIQELSIKSNNYRIIRRRIAWLIRKWTSVRTTSDMNLVLYQALVDLLRPDEDMAVRLAASDAIHEMVVDFNFVKEQFLPVLSSVFSLLISLLKEADECDTKMRVLTVLSSIAGRNEQAVVGYMDNFLGYLSQLWEHAEQHDMLKCAIVAAMVKIVTILGSWEDPTMKNMILSVLEEATDMTKSSHVYLLEDSLKLWETALACCPSPPHSVDELLRLAYNIPVMLDQSTEYIKAILDVVYNYLLLMPEPFLMGAGGKCMTMMESMLSDLLVEGVIMILRVVESCLILQLPGENSLIGVKAVWPIILKILRSMQQSDDEDSHLPTLLSLQMTIIFRLLLKSSHLFSEAFREAANGGDPVELLSKVLKVCCEGVCVVTELQHRKVIGLGLSALLTGKIMCVIERFPVIMVNITEIMNDVMKTDENGQQSDLLLSAQDSKEEEEDIESEYCLVEANTPQDKRLHDLLDIDIVRTVDIRVFLISQLEELKNQVGLQTFAQLVQSIPPVTLQQLKEYIDI